MTHFEPIALSAQIPEGTGIAVQIHGRSVALFRADGILFALDNICPHAGAALAHGARTCVSCTPKSRSLLASQRRNPNLRQSRVYLPLSYLNDTLIRDR